MKMPRNTTDTKVYLVSVPLVFLVVATSDATARLAAHDAVIDGSAMSTADLAKMPHGTLITPVSNPTTLSYIKYPRDEMPVTSENCGHIVTLKQAFAEQRKFIQQRDRERISRADRALAKARAAKKKKGKKS
jgi:hypothetical protein